MKIAWREQWENPVGTDETIFALNKKGEIIGAVCRGNDSIGADQYNGYYQNSWVCGRRTREECQQALAEIIRERAFWRRSFDAAGCFFFDNWLGIVIVLVIVGLVGFVFWDAFKEKGVRATCKATCTAHGFPESDIERNWFSFGPCLCSPQPSYVKFPLLSEQPNPTPEIDNGK